MTGKEITFALFWNCRIKEELPWRRDEETSETAVDEGDDGDEDEEFSSCLSNHFLQATVQKS